MKKYVGVLEKFRVIKTQPLLARFTLKTRSQSINCVVADVEIADKLLMMKEGQQHLCVTGHLNKRNQLVIETMQCS
ncbi:hypothetical protein [Enterococcus ratti]|uniref:hypothetical protein n=1 Tax=Enterococcus ratti TaxID=150033 RepID=UPI0009003407|nr:hypothetical protein [Enterococcus ratti]